MTKYRTKRARLLRKTMTNAEKKLWNRLRNRQLNGIKFRRQYACGNYYFDFYCPEHKICVEADGGQHYRTKESLYDINRNKYINSLGIRIFRYSDGDIMKNIEAVINNILCNVEQIDSSPLPSPQGGEETTKEKNKHKEDS